MRRKRTKYLGCYSMPMRKWKTTSLQLVVFCFMGYTNFANAQSTPNGFSVSGSINGLSSYLSGRLGQTENGQISGLNPSNERLISAAPTQNYRATSTANATGLGIHCQDIQNATNQTLQQQSQQIVATTNPGQISAQNGYATVQSTQITADPEAGSLWNKFMNGLQNVGTRVGQQFVNSEISTVSSSVANQAPNYARNTVGQSAQAVQRTSDSALNQSLNQTQPPQKQSVNGFN